MNKKHIGKITTVLFLLLCILYACKKEKNEPTSDLGYEYFPNEAGRYVIYDVDSIVYDDFENDTDIYKYELKEVIESMFTDNQGRETQRIERYIRKYNDTIPYSQLPWTIKDVWYANRTINAAEKVEENERFVKLIFPTKESKTWNGNVYNTRTAWEYEYSDVHEAKSYGSLSFDSTLVVKQYDDEGQILIHRQLYTETYAKNVGLIYREIIEVKSKNITSKPVMDRITSGVVYKQQVKAYGKL